MNIIQALDDERFFKGLFKDSSTWASWRVFLKALFGLPIEDKKELELFRKCTGRKEFLSKQARECYVIAGRRSGKSFISAVIAVYLACFFDWTPFLTTGELGSIFIIATDKEQARIVKAYIDGILNSTPHLAKTIEKSLVWEIELNTRVNIAIKTASFKTVRGFTLLAVIAEELAFWRDSETSANPAQEILTALRPALSTIPNSLLLGISTPYSRSGVLWEHFHKHYGNDEREAPLVWQADTFTMNPTINKSIIENALRDDYSAASAEWLARFRDDLEQFLSLELIEQAVIPGRIELPKIADTRYFAHCDPSGGRGDSMTLAISHKDSDSQKIVLDAVREARPPFVPRDVVKDFSKVLKSYGVERLQLDRYAAEWTVSAFRDEGIMPESVKKSASELYINFLPLISNRSIELLDNKRLVSQFKSLERKTRSGGRDLVDHPPGAHDDLSNATAGACVLASEIQENDSEIILSLLEAEAESILTDEEELERRFTTWLLGGELPPTKEEQEGKPRQGKPRTVLTVSEWDRRNDK